MARAAKPLDSSTISTNGASHAPEAPSSLPAHLRFVAAGKLEADTLFRSSYYPDSFRFPYNPDDLARGNDYSIYDEMRDDDQVKAAMSLKIDMLLNSGWKIVCDKEDVREFVKSTLTSAGEDEAIEDGFDESVRDIADSAYSYGFSLSEAVYRSPARSKSGMWELARLIVRPPHSFLFHLDPKGSVEWIEQYADRGSRKFKPDIFLHYAYQSKFGNPYGKSDLRAAFKPWKAKKFIFRMAMRYAERFAGGLTVGRYDPSKGQAELTAIQNALASIQDNTTLTIPKDLEVEIIQTARDSSDTYNKLLHMLDTKIARSLLIPDLLGMSGEQTGGGSYSLGKEHFRVFQSSISNDRAALARRITAKMVRPLVQANFGDVECHFEFNPMEIGEENEFLRLWIEAVNGGIFKPNEDEINHLRRKTGFPEGPVEIPEPPPQLEPEIPGQPKPDAADPKKTGDVEEAPAERVEAVRFSKLTPYEQKVDFARVVKVLDASEKAAWSEVAGVLRRMAADMLERVKERGLLERFKPEALADMEPKFKKELNSFVRGHFMRLFRDSRDVARDEIMPRRKEFVAGDIFPEDFEEIIRAESFKMVGDLSNEVRKRFSNQMFNGLKNGTSFSELSERIAKDIEGYAEHQVRTILRTKTTEVFNSARKTFFETDEVASGLIDGYQYSAVIDDSTTPICQSLHGRQFSREEVNDRPEVNPPLHWNCRSLLVPITKFEPRKFVPIPKAEVLRSRGGNLIPAKER